MSRLSQGLDGERRSIRICLLLASAFILLAIGDYVDTAPRVFEGRYAALSAILFDHFGAAGLAAHWLVPAVMLLMCARFIWRHAAKTPRDRWYRR
jgi:hypothetical protein